MGLSVHACYQLASKNRAESVSCLPKVLLSPVPCVPSRCVWLRGVERTELLSCSFLPLGVSHFWGRAVVPVVLRGRVTRDAAPRVLGTCEWTGAEPFEGVSWYLVL